MLLTSGSACAGSCSGSVPAALPQLPCPLPVSITIPMARPFGSCRRAVWCCENPLVLITSFWVQLHDSNTVSDGAAVSGCHVPVPALPSDPLPQHQVPGTSSCVLWGLAGALVAPRAGQAATTAPLSPVAPSLLQGRAGDVCEPCLSCGRCSAALGVHQGWVLQRWLRAELSPGTELGATANTGHAKGQLPALAHVGVPEPGASHGFVPFPFLVLFVLFPSLFLFLFCFSFHFSLFLFFLFFSFSFPLTFFSFYFYFYFLFLFLFLFLSIMPFPLYFLFFFFFLSFMFPFSPFFSHYPDVLHLQFIPTRHLV